MREEKHVVDHFHGKVLRHLFNIALVQFLLPKNHDCVIEAQYLSRRYWEDQGRLNPDLFLGPW